MKFVFDERSGSSYRGSTGVRLALLLVLAAIFAGCTLESSDEAPPQKRVRVEVPNRGVPLELLKPQTTEQEAVETPSQVEPWVAKRPHVHWFIDGEQVKPIDPPVEPEAFRIDFDETQPITFEIMPFAFMTEISRQIVVRRGDVAEAFTDPRISESERLLPIFYCDNRSCPRIEEVQRLARFPWDVKTGDSPECPFCNSVDADGKKTTSYRFWMPQQLNMQDAMKRQIYDKRKGTNGQ